MLEHLFFGRIVGIHIRRYANIGIDPDKVYAVLCHRVVHGLAFRYLGLGRPSPPLREKIIEQAWVSADNPHCSSRALSAPIYIIHSHYIYLEEIRRENGSPHSESGCLSCKVFL